MKSSTHSLQLSKVAFYPCCARDFLEPLEMLDGYTDEVVFCDPCPSVKTAFTDFAWQMSVGLPKARLISDGARRGIQMLERIDVLFYRRDSQGEGGSGVLVLAKPFILSVLERMPPEGGLIITDGSNHGNHYYQKTFRPQVVKKFGYHLYALPRAPQPFLEHDLKIIEVKRL